MHRLYVGPFHRFAVDTLATGSAEVWDAERPDERGRATLVHTAPDRDAAVAWVRERIAADPTMQEVE
jgi:hypothetical protein